MNDAIDRYRPRISDLQQAAIGDFVAAAVRDASPRTAEETRQWLSASTRLTIWCWQQGYPLDRDVVFRPQIISDFIDHGLPKSTTKSRGTYRAKLMAVSDAVVDPAHRRARFKPLNPGPSAGPYNERELAFIRAWAINQRTDYNRVNATVLLALGLGAGLATRELCGVRAAHITTDDAGVLVEVVDGYCPRQVPVVEVWESTLTSISKAAIRPDQFVFKPRRTVEYHRNQIGNFVARTSGVPFPINATRMRATWIVQHLAAGVPMKVVTEAAGLANVACLAPYLPHVPGWEPLQAREALRRLTVRDGSPVTRAERLALAVEGNLDD